MPAGVTYVTEKHLFLVKRVVTHTWHWVLSERGLAGEEARECAGPGEVKGWCLKK